MGYSLRPWQTEDTAALRKLKSYAYTAASMEKSSKVYPYAVEKEGQTVGLAAASVQDMGGELFLCLLPAVEETDEIAEFIRELCEIQFQQGVEKVYAQVLSVCGAEIDALEAAGFQSQGILRQTLPDGKKIVDFCVYVLARP